MTVSGRGSIESAHDLPVPEREDLRGLLLALADNKRLLGIRYADCMLGSPSLETGIAASSMAQDEWGHARLTYALLADFGDEPTVVEHERPAVAYMSMAVLDRPWDSWTDMIAAAAVVDPALTIQYEALFESRYAPARNRVQKLLDEEVLHFQYAAAWTARLAASELRDQLTRSIVWMLSEVVRWLGADDDPSAARLLAAGLVDATPSALRAEYLQRVGPLLEECGLASVDAGPDGWDKWDVNRRRDLGAGPDPDTLARVRGDVNRAMLLD